MAAQKAKKNVLYFHSEQLDLINFPCKKLTAKPSDIFLKKKNSFDYKYTQSLRKEADLSYRCPNRPLVDFVMNLIN